MTDDKRTHWDAVYGEKSEAEFSWHQDDPEVSLDLIGRAGIGPTASVIDVGGGTSRLAEALLDRGLRDVTVLDLSQVALTAARERLGPAGESVTWLCADITTWVPARQYDLWHDRAVFHFLVDALARDAYLERMERALKPGGHAIIATFAPDGPTSCSGLPVCRYSPADLAEALEDGFALVEHRSHKHRTPWGSTQSFQFSLFRRTSATPR
ncbi:class I SAM-dependent methyltransferase [Histidinibacterium aquaticum]|uniref:Class I SAM-dependent methyltransferase n=1 Tax=Histidinibacterium aquaticum TaxID=2613962 RepID=A0A5J5GRJ7_9RHOB|nr:class I SAM-dependent methyltransferase [Histidinibacterium aquaticum]KAA9009992.1 class I SAM-dependent methyltransferase [Histidinibacterium aquaticum]